MPAKSVIATTGPLATGEVRALLERCRVGFADFTEVWPQDVSCTGSHRKGLPALPASGSWEMARLELRATLDARRVTPQLVTEMLRHGPAAVPEGGAVSVWGRLTEAAKFPAEHGFVEAAWDRGAYWLGFRPDGKRSLDEAARDGTFEQAQQGNLAEALSLLARGIEEARLPLEEVPQARGRTFRHTAGGRWSFAVSHRDRGPMHYYCEMPGVAPEDLAGRLETLLDLCASPLPRSYFLVVRVPNPPGALAYEFAGRAEWPVTAAEINAVVRLTGCEGLEVLRRLTTSKGGLGVALGVFSLPPAGGGTATLSAKVKPAGHELKLTLPAAHAELLPEFSRRLGTAFRQ